jgi:hypothetical protein
MFLRKRLSRLEKFVVERIGAKVSQSDLIVEVSKLEKKIELLSEEVSAQKARADKIEKYLSASLDALGIVFKERPIVDVVKSTPVETAYKSEVYAVQKRKRKK